MTLHLNPSLCKRLLGDPNPTLSSKKSYRYGAKGSLVVNLEAGIWFDHEQQAGGGMLDLVIYTKHAKTRREAYHWLHGTIQSPAIERHLPIQQSPEKLRKDKLALAAGIWRGTRKLAETPALEYLSKVRNIKPEIILAATNLRYHDGICEDPYRPHTASHCALVARVLNPSGQAIGVHITYLTRQGAKANLAIQKRMIGTGFTGAGVILHSGRPKTVVVAEGIETALAIATLTGMATTAALSVGSILHWAPLDKDQSIQFAADNDIPCPKYPIGIGLENAISATQRLKSEGFSVSDPMIPPAGHNDFNSYLQSTLIAV